MHEFDAAHWLQLIEALIATLDSAERRQNPDEVVASGSKATTYARFASLCSDIGLETAAEIAREIERASKKNGYTHRKHAEDLRILKRTVVANMRSVKFMRIAPDYVRYLGDIDDDVFKAFPDAVEDFFDAGSALAYGLGTAAVFHLMRVMEVGLKQLAKELGIPYAPSWESYLKQLGDRFGEKWKDKSEPWRRDEPYFKELVGDLQTVKMVWRNPTMHIVRTYRQAEAREIYNAVMAFMKRLTERPSAQDDEASPF